MAQAPVDLLQRVPLFQGLIFSFQAISAFVSTSGRKSHGVMPYAFTSLSAVTVADRAPSSISATSPK